MEPSPGSLKKLVDESSTLVDWITSVLTGQNPVSKILLLDAILLCFLNPVLLPPLITTVTGKDISGLYWWAFWPAVISIFLVAVVIAVRVKHRQAASGPSPNERSGVKGLLPFAKDDAELFSRLQREDSLRECLNGLANNDFRFGILSGESGCGKSSFLQAGICSRLEERGHRCVYIKFTDLDPLDSIRLAVREQLGLPKTALPDIDLVSMLDTLAEEDPKPITLLFDQFEQFFVHRKREKQRKPFVQELANWFRNAPPGPGRILISVREDFVGRLVELQKAMGYSLGVTQSFQLKKFEPKKAARIFKEIAKTENASFDEAFLDEFCEEELASRDDGLISPVDIQLIVWMVAAQPQEENRIFNRASFQKLGGVEGLLETFLNRALAVRETESRRQAAIKVLLALTDLDDNVRGGVLTLDVLKEKLAGTASNAEIDEAVEWLTRSDVRLVNSVENGYELAHERLIPALRRVAGKTLSVVDQANRLLDQRVDEWLINNRASRYLPTLREWRLIEKLRPYLVWGPKRLPKEALLAETKRRWVFRFAAVITPVLLGLLGFGSYEIWRRSDSGRLFRIKNDLISFSDGVNDRQSLEVVVESLIFADRRSEAFQVVERIKDPNDHFYLLDVAAVASVNANQSPQSIARAIETINRINDPRDKSLAIMHVSDALVRVGTARQSAEILERAFEISKNTPDANAESPIPIRTIVDHSLRNIAIAFAKLAAQKQSTSLLNRALDIAKTIKSAGSRASALVALSDAMGTIHFDRAVELFDQIVGLKSDWMLTRVQFEAFNKFIFGISRRNDPIAAEILIRANAFAENDTVSEFKANAFGVLAVAHATRDAELSSQLLDKAIKSAQETTDENERAVGYAQIAEAICTLYPDRAVELLQLASQTAKGIEDDLIEDEAEALIDVPNTIVRIAINKQLSGLFAKAAALVSSDSHKVSLIRVVTGNPLNERESKHVVPAVILNAAGDVAEKIETPSNRAEALVLLANVYSRTDGSRAASVLRQTFQIVEKQNEKSLRRTVVNEIASALQKTDLLQSPAITHALEFAHAVENPFHKAKILLAIAEQTAKFDVHRSTELFDLAANTLKQEEKNKESFLPEVGKALARASIAAHSTVLLNKGITLAQEINDANDRPAVLSDLAAAAARLKDLAVAHQIALMNNDNGNKARVLALILKTWAIVKNPELEELDFISREETANQAQAQETGFRGPPSTSALPPVMRQRLYSIQTHYALPKFSWQLGVR